MAALSNAERFQLRERFETHLLDDVRIIHFTQRQHSILTSGDEESYFGETLRVVEEIASLSDGLQLAVHDFVEDGTCAALYGVERVPCTILETSDNRRIRHFGLPGGYLFNNFVQAIIDVSRQSGRVSPATREALQKIDTELHLLVLTNDI